MERRQRNLSAITPLLIGLGPLRYHHKKIKKGTWRRGKSYYVTLRSGVPTDTFSSQPEASEAIPLEALPLRKYWVSET